MYCKKVKLTKVEAETKLNKYNKLGNFKHGYGRIYCCPICKFWHLTAKVKQNRQIKFDDFKEMNQNSKRMFEGLTFKKKWLKLLNNK